MQKEQGRRLNLRQNKYYSYLPLLASHQKNMGERVAVLERDMSDVKKELTEMNKRLSGIEKTMEKIESLLGWLKWIGGGIIAIALSLIANFVYSLIV